ncbi:MAG: hypothetical protein IKZ87_02165 [Actinomycetaceae bacterium]|nr:hypothetical protein [Actinomycetaceae bacterium]
MAAEETSEWSWAAAESIAETRMSSGGLSRGAAADLMRSVLSTFRNGIPDGMAVWRDSCGGWIWTDHTAPSHVRVRACSMSENSDIPMWVDYINDGFAGKTLVGAAWGGSDSSGELLKALNAQPASVVLGGSLFSVSTPEGSSGAWLRPMGAGELMRFQVAAANEMGLGMVVSGEYKSLDEARREAFRKIETELRDGVSSPGHRLYSLCYGGQTVGGAWLELDGGVGVVRSIVVESMSRGEGHRRAALAALIAAAHMEGARQIQTTITPVDHPLVDVLRGAGMEILITNYVYTPNPIRTPALVR